MLLAALKRLEETVEAETEALLTRRRADHAALNRAKSQSLLELTRLTRGLDPAGIDAPRRSTSRAFATGSPATSRWSACTCAPSRRSARRSPPPR